MTTDGDSFTRYSAALAVGAIGKHGVGPLLDVLESEKGTGAIESITALGIIGPDARKATPLLRLRLLGHARPTLDDAELRLRLAEILAVLSAAPHGLSAEALCAELHGDGGSVSSVRVEVSRLRKLIGPWVGTDVYRLTCDVESDVRKVEGLLNAGQVAAAAEAYGGPLLPTSEAPGVGAAWRKPRRAAAESSTAASR